MPVQGTGLFSGISLSLNGTPSSTTLSSSATSTTTLPAQSTTALSPPRTMDSKYLEQLRSLNVSVSEWIAKHVRDNPFVDLTPIFRDYETHLKNIDNKVSRDEGMDCSTDLGSFGYNHFLSSLLPPFLLSSLLPSFLFSSLLPPFLSPPSLPSSQAPPTTVEAVTHDTNSEEEGEGCVKGEEEEGESSEGRASGVGVSLHKQANPGPSAC